MRIVRSISAFAAALAVTAAVAAPAGAALAPPSQQVLRVGIVGVSDGGTLDPARVNYLDSANRVRPLLLPLYDSRADGSLQPRLAAGQPLVSADRRRVTVRLRAARWSDGRQVASADVVSALQRARAARNYFTTFTTNVVRVSTPNSRTVVLHLRRPDATIVPMLTSTIFTPVPTHVIRRAGSRWTAPGKMVSSGPFVLAAKTASRLTYRRNARYFAARGVRLQRLELATYPSAAALARALRSRTVDSTFQNSFAPRSTQAGPGIAVLRAPTWGAQYAYLNTRNDALASPAVRRGLALAIDRAAIAGLGLGDPLSTTVPPNVPAPAGAAPTSSLLAADGRPDPDGARAQLAAGGWVDARALTIAYVTGSGNASRIAAIIAGSLADVGVRTELRAVSAERFATVGVGISPVRSEYDIVLQGWILDYPDRWNVLQLFTCRAIADGLNTSNFCDAGYDAAAATQPTLVGAPRAALFSRLETMLTGTDGSMPVIPLYRQTDVVHSQRWIRSLVIGADGLFQWERTVIDRH